MLNENQCLSQINFGLYLWITFVVFSVQRDIFKDLTTFGGANQYLVLLSCICTVAIYLYGGKFYISWQFYFNTYIEVFFINHIKYIVFFT